MAIRRFKPIASVAISLSENGEYVRYEDYIALMDELEDVRKRTEELEEIASYYGLKLKKAQIALKFAALRHKNSSKRIAELEARAVNLPKRSVGEVMRMSGFSREYAEGWCSGNDNAIHEIHAAGIRIKGE
nr:ead/Ea22-like family protein [Salmonella enterica]